MSAPARDAFNGDEVSSMPKKLKPRDVEFRGGAHPNPERPVCSCCFGQAPAGVAAFAAGKDPDKGDAYVFLCTHCVQLITLACP